jgi:hypothetical protein
MVGSKLFPPKSETRSGSTPTELPRCRNAALTGSKSITRPPGLPRAAFFNSTLGYPARGPASWRRRSESSIITDSAGVGFTATLRVRCNILDPGSIRRIQEPKLPNGRCQCLRARLGGGPSVVDKGGPNENACFNPAACGRSHGLCACGLDEYDRSAGCVCGWPVLRRPCVYRS